MSGLTSVQGVISCNYCKRGNVGVSWSASHLLHPAARIGRLLAMLYGDGMVLQVPSLSAVT
jgi:hypothetical protein